MHYLDKWGLEMSDFTSRWCIVHYCASDGLWGSKIHSNPPRKECPKCRVSIPKEILVGYKLLRM